MITVTAPSGAEYSVLNKDEQIYFADLCKRYAKDNKLLNVSDVMDLDRIIYMEMQIWRWSNWLSSEFDYDGDPIHTGDYSKYVKDYSAEVRMVKKDLGLNKSSRDANKNEDVSGYLENVRQRAQEFGVMRNEQAYKVIELGQELIAQIDLYKNCTEKERKELTCTEEDIVNWIAETFIPEFQTIDKDFIKEKQKIWIRDI